MPNGLTVSGATLTLARPGLALPAMQFSRQRICASILASHSSLSVTPMNVSSGLRRRRALSSIVIRHRAHTAARMCAEEALERGGDTGPTNSPTES